VPCRSPLSHLFAWIERAIGAMHPSVISHRPWLPQTHHTVAETTGLLAAAGLDTTRWTTFGFPPPQAVTTEYLDRRGGAGRLVRDTIESVCTALPLGRRLGSQLLIEARKVREPATPRPVPGVWRGPLIQRPSGVGVHMAPVA
jgi:hypothetical protein